MYTVLSAWFTELNFDQLLSQLGSYNTLLQLMDYEILGTL